MSSMSSRIEDADTAAPAEEDMMMDEAPVAVESPEETDPTLLAFEEQRVRIVREVSYILPVWQSSLTDFQLPGSTDTAASFEFKKEDHTLGNALRYIIMKKYDLLHTCVKPQHSCVHNKQHGNSSIA
jgi:DNA-directed RNA polymerase I and III subunit RPAC2